MEVPMRPRRIIGLSSTIRLPSETKYLATIYFCLEVEMYCDYFSSCEKTVNQTCYHRLIRYKVPMSLVDHLEENEQKEVGMDG